MSENRIGDEPIEKRWMERMNAMAMAIDQMINGRHEEDMPPKFGFILQVFAFGSPDARCNYISNARRSDVITMLRYQLERFEEQDRAERTASHS